MSDSSQADEAIDWARQTLANVVQEIMDEGVIDSPLLESKPAWTKPFDIVIGKLRDQGQHAEFLWVIGGSVPTDCVHSGVASTARDAARHFSMKWQLEAARLENLTEQQRLGLDPATDWQAEAKALIAKAEYLYSIIDDDRFWS
ncbi:MAG: DUF4826 family protein [Gammaproteobacteria bacterium]|nr:DUF4826 family protein [Gammaproteobacteria bacterium]